MLATAPLSAAGLPISPLLLAAPKYARELPSTPLDSASGLRYYTVLWRFLACAYQQDLQLLPAVFVVLAVN